MPRPALAASVINVRTKPRSGGELVRWVQWRRTCHLKERGGVPAREIACDEGWLELIEIEHPQISSIVVDVLRAGKETRPPVQLAMVAADKR
jgi:hypothetical protein